MKKILIIMPMLAAAVFLSGCSDGGKSPAVKETVETKESSQDSLIGSLKDAIGLGKKMECVSKEDGMETRSYIDGTKYKAVSETKEGKMVMVFDGKDFHMWNEKTKEGFVMTKSCIDGLNKGVSKMEGAEDVSGDGNFRSTEEIIAEESLDNCKETGPIDFTVPTDVKFVDQCELMKNIPADLGDLQIPARL